MPSNSDENLLFGILAFQMDFLRREQLVAATKDWLEDKSRDLSDVLVQQGALRESDRQLLAPLVARHLENHDGDAVHCLAALSSVNAVTEELRALGDEEIEATLSIAADGSAQLERRARAIFLETLEAAPIDLEDYLSSQCGDDAPLRQAVERLLASHQALGAALVSDGAIDSTRIREPLTPARRSAGNGNRFRVLRPHAKGGLGEVSVAKDVELNRDVALKEIQSRFADDEASRSRFVLEAEVTGGLEHPGIVPVYGLGRYDDGRPFYAMRFIKGDSLQEATERIHQGGPVDYDSVEFRKLLGRFIDVCEAIEYAHSRGVLHRDLKPGNIMLGKYGETLVVDWGLAKLLWRDDVDEVSDEQTLRPSGAGSGSAPTQMGSAIGTPAFMPPEQAHGDLNELGPASDVYSLGATLYYVLTAQRPFTSRKLVDVLEAVKSGDFASPRTVKPALPKPLDAICLKAMSLQPDDRYASPMKLADDVQRWLGDEPVVALPEPWMVRARRWMRKHPTVVVSLAASLLVGLVSVVVLWAVVSRKNTELASTNGRLTTTNQELAAANQQIADKNLALEAANLKNRRAATRLAVDKAQSNGDAAMALLWYVRALELCPDQDPATRDMIHANLAYWRRDAARLTHHAPQITPDWQGQSCLSSNAERLYNVNDDGSVLIHEVGSGKQRQLPKPDAAVALSTRPNFGVSDDESIFAAAWGDTIQLWDVETSQLLGPPTKVDGVVSTIGLSVDGSRVAAGTAQGDVHILQVKTGQWGKVSHGRSPVSAVAFRPDGQALLSAGYDGRIRRWKIADANAEEIGEALIDNNAGPVVVAIWSPNGSHIASGDFASVRIWKAESGEVAHRTKLDMVIVSLAFSHDGTRVIAGLGEGRAVVIDGRSNPAIKFSLQHNTSVELAQFREGDQQVVTLTNWGEPHVWTLPTPPQIMTVEGIEAEEGALHPNGRVVALRTLSGFIQLFDIEKAEPIGERIKYEEPVAGIAFSKDGEHLLVTSFRGTCRVLATDGLKPVGEPLKTGGVARQGVFLDEDRVAIAVASRGDIAVYNYRSGERLNEETPHPFVTWMSTAGARLFAAGGRGQIHAYDTSTMSKLFTTTQDERDWLSCASSKKGNYVAATSKQIVRIYDGADGRLLTELPHTNSVVKGAAFSEDNRLLATIGSDSFLRVWHRETGKQVGPQLRFTDLTTGICFKPKQIVTIGNRFKATEVIVVSRPNSLANTGIAALNRWVQVQTGRKLQADGTSRFLTAEEWRSSKDELDAAADSSEVN